MRLNILCLALLVSLVAAAQIWEEKTPMPLPRAGYMAGVVAGRLLIAGGSYWESGRKRWTERVDLFDPAANSWKSAEPLPEPRSDAAGAAVGDAFYLFGGGSGDTARQDALIYRSGHWRKLPEANLSAPLLYAMAVAEGGRIYISGGLSRAGDYGSATNALRVWDPAHPRTGWQNLPPIPGPARFTHAMESRHGRIFVFGGAAGAGDEVRNLNDAYRYDIQTSTWTRLPDLPVARRAWCALADLKRILLLGGYTTGYEPEIYACDPESGQCELGGALPHPLADDRFVRIGAWIIASGGETADRIRASWTVAARSEEIRK